MAMTVNELRTALDELIAQGNGEVEIMFAYNYGDYWRSTVAQPLTIIAEAQVKHSDYHSMDKVVENRMDEDEPAEIDGTRTVLIFE